MSKANFYGEAPARNRNGLRRLLRDVRIKLPMDRDRIDYNLIERTMNRAPGFTALKALLNED